MQATEEMYTRDLQQGASKLGFNKVQVNSVMRDLRKTAQVMQSGVCLYKAGRIVGCRNVYVIFLIIVIS